MELYAHVLLAALLLLALFYVWRWFGIERHKTAGQGRRPGVWDLAVGFGTNLLDTLGIGSFATSTTAFKLFRRVPDEQIPGTLNVGHALPTLVQATVFIAVVSIDPLTLIGMMTAAIAGAWLGAGVVTRLPPQGIRIGMGLALLAAAWLLCASNLGWMPSGGEATGLTGWLLALAIAVNFALGALMTLGIGLYAPCLIVVSLLGMSPLSAFPIMMGSCAFLMPVAGLRFIRSGRYSLSMALGLALGGIPGVLLAAFVIRSLPIVLLRWLVVVVVLYTAVVMLKSARRGS